MNSATCQKEAFPLAGLLSIVMVDSASLLSKLDIGNAQNMLTNVDIESAINLSKPDIGAEVVLAIVSIWNLIKPNILSPIAGGEILSNPKFFSAAEKVIFLTFIDGVEGFSDVTTREGKEFSESIKKGSISNATLWSADQPDRDFCRMQKSILEQNQSITNSGFLTEIREIKGLAVTTIFSQFGTRRVFSKELKSTLEQNQNIAAAQVNRVTINYSVQPSGVSLVFFRCSPLSLRPQASSTQAEKLALGFSGLSRSTLASISSINSCGKRIPFRLDLLLTFFVAIGFSPRWCVSTIHKSGGNKTLDVLEHLGLWCSNTLFTGKVQATHKIATPRSAGTLPRRLTTTVNYSNEAAMKNHTTPLTGRNSLTPNKFTWRFLAISRTDRSAKPCSLSVVASTEREARKVLAPHFILSLSARLPVQGVSHA